MRDILDLLGSFVRHRSGLHLPAYPETTPQRGPLPPIEGGSRLRLVKITTPANPPASDAELYYATAGTGLNTPAAMLAAVDENGNVARLAGFTVLDYRLLTVRTLITGSTSYVPSAGTRAIYVEMVGGGAQGGGCATSSSTCSVGSGGGGGSYAASFLTGAAVKNPTTYAVGAAGSAGAAGATGAVGSNSTWDTTVIIAVGGSGGLVLAAGTSVLEIAGGIGGLASTSTGDSKVNGGNGHTGFRGSLTIGFGGDGGGSFFAPGAGGSARAAVTGGAVGVTPTAGQYGVGGGGSATITTQQAGGVGLAGAIRVWEFA